MALKVFEGFDHYNNGNDLFQRSGFLQWEIINAGWSLITSPGRNGRGKALGVHADNDGGPGQSGAAARSYAVFADRNAEAYLGFAFNITTGRGAYIALTDSVGAAYQIVLFFNPSNYSITAYTGGAFYFTYQYSGTVLGVTGNNVWTGGVWQFLEIHPVIGTSGSVQVKINNTVVMTLSGVNTRTSSNNWFDKLGFVESPVGNGGTFMTVDDLYYCDTTTGPGLVPANTYLGDSSTATLFTIGNDSVSWTPLTGTNWGEVSETAMDSDTSYNSTTTVGNEDRFNFGALGSVLDTVFAVQVTGAYRKDDGGTRTIEQSVWSGGTETYGAGHNIPDVTYAYFTDLWVLNPTTGLNWTLTDINAMKAGYKLTA